MLSEAYQDLGKSIKEVKQKCLAEIKLLVQQAVTKLQGNGFQVYVAESAARASEYISSLLERNKPVLLAGTTIDKELGLYEFLSGQGYEVIDAGPDSRALRILSLEPGHPIYHLSGYEKTDICNRLKAYYGENDFSLEDWQEEHFKLLAAAGAGITGCTAIIAQEGVILISEERENIHIASTLPPVHILVVGMDKIVHNLEEALLVARGVSFYGMGKPVSRNLFFIAGPSATADIQGLIVRGMHGPREVHVILLDNGRTEALKQPARDLLMCIECGNCLKACQVCQQKGPVFSKYQAPPFYSSWTLARGGNQGDCLNCGLCIQACPLGINIFKILKESGQSGLFGEVT
ncbi:lactate utilization protein [Desulfallas sp. Bu1-1]|uniref:LUD domain-containing protein n=1 Tax=Desulfallas sp. Bu1-1 TaxID=2787620 RepID=UPI00189F2837|nr:LUD domain-containing protein [Desulfallas sp. Bu1-1]MBF7083660.1 lactate utilization protein [Desulfallas sp. Bu1-1]